MNKKLLRFLFFLILLFWGTMNFSPTIQKPINESFNILKSFYSDTLALIDNSIDEHFFQAHTIQRLKRELDRCKKNTLELYQLKQELNDLYKALDTNLSADPRVELVRAIAYEKFGDTNRVWLNVKEYNASKIYGLVYKNQVAGIVVPKEGMPLGLLLRDAKSSYAVRIGSAKAPGIAHGNDDKNIVVTFIPTWYNISVGDEVVTSGLDNVFFDNLKVGKVLSLTTSQGYQKAIVKPYYTMDTLNYFYMIKRTK